MAECVGICYTDSILGLGSTYNRKLNKPHQYSLKCVYIQSKTFKVNFLKYTYIHFSISLLWILIANWILRIYVFSKYLIKFSAFIRKGHQNPILGDKTSCKRILVIFPKCSLNSRYLVRVQPKNLTDRFHITNCMRVIHKPLETQTHDAQTKIYQRQEIN